MFLDRAKAVGVLLAKEVGSWALHRGSGPREVCGVS